MGDGLCCVGFGDRREQRREGRRQVEREAQPRMILAQCLNGVPCLPRGAEGRGGEVDREAHSEAEERGGRQRRVGRVRVGRGVREVRDGEDSGGKVEERAVREFLAEGDLSVVPDAGIVRVELEPWGEENCAAGWQGGGEEVGRLKGGGGAPCFAGWVSGAGAHALLSGVPCVRRELNASALVGVTSRG